jgi:hypothetical protein
MTTEKTQPTRFRYVYIGIGTLLALLLLLISDPQSGLIENLPFGASTVANIVLLFRVIIYAALLHVTRKGLFDYIDLERVFNQAIRTSEGAGKVFIGMAIFCVGIAILINAAVR